MTKTINGKIVGWKLVEKTKSDPAPASTLTSDDVKNIREKLGISSLKMPRRPTVVSGFTLRLKYNSYGSVYITLNYDSITNRLIEVFVTSSKTSPKHQAYANVIARMVSNQIKFGVPLDQIYKHLLGIDEGDAAFVQFPGKEKSILIRSMPDLIGNALRIYPTYSHLEPIVWEEDIEESDTEVLDPKLYQEILFGETEKLNNLSQKKEEKQEPFSGICEFNNTTDCPDANWVHEAGCETCLTCGFSRCS